MVAALEEYEEYNEPPQEREVVDDEEEEEDEEEEKDEKEEKGKAVETIPLPHLRKVASDETSKLPEAATSSKEIPLPMKKRSLLVGC